MPQMQIIRATGDAMRDTERLKRRRKGRRRGRRRGKRRGRRRGAVRGSGVRMKAKAIEMLGIAEGRVT